MKEKESERKRPIMTQEKQKNISMIAGILFVLSFMLGLFSSRLTLKTILYLVGVAAIAYCLFTKRKDFVIGAGMGMLFLSQLVGVIKYHAGFLGFLEAIGYAAAALICISVLTDYLPQLKEIGKKLWFVPAILVGLYVLRDIRFLISWFHPAYLKFVFADLIEAAAVLFAMMWAVNVDGLPDAEAMPEKKEKAGVTRSAAQTTNSTDEVYCGLAKHVLLLLFTFGVWMYIWIYRVTGYTNGVDGEEDRNPTTKLLLCLFVPFYIIYWTYKTAQRIDAMANEKGVPSDLSTLCLILAIFVPIIPPILMQDKMNSLVACGEGGAGKTVVQAAPAKAEKKTAELGTADELKKYKELLDMGVITAEEFDAKKKQLLGL